MKILRLVLLLCLITGISSGQTKPHWLDLAGKPSADIREYGAVSGSGDDTAAFTAAIAANNSIFVPPGTWIASGVVIPFDGVTIQGTGRDSIIVTPLGANASFVRQEDLTEAEFIATYSDAFYFQPWEITNLRFKVQGNYAIIDLLPFYGDGNRNSRFTNNYVELGDNATAIKTRASWMLDISGNTFDGYWDATTSSAQYATNTTAIEFNASNSPVYHGTMAARVSNNVFTTVSTPFDWSGTSGNSAAYAEGLYFVNNSFVNCNYGINFRRVNNLNILGNHFATVGYNEIDITDCSHLLFSNNWVQSPVFDDSGSMLNIVASDTEVVQTNVTNNLFYVTGDTTDWTGIYLRRDAGGFLGVKISDNQFYGAYTTPTATSSRFLLAAAAADTDLENVLIDGNFIWQAYRCFQFTNGKNIRIVGNQYGYSNIILSGYELIDGLDAPGIYEQKKVSMTGVVTDLLPSGQIVSFLDVFPSGPTHGELTAELTDSNFYSLHSTATATTDIITDTTGLQHLRINLKQTAPIVASCSVILASFTVELKALSHNGDNNYH